MLEEELLMSNNPLLKLQEYGQSIWLDDLRRKMIQSGELQRLIDEDGIRGVTSNPAIFEKAITGNPEYEKDIRALAAQGKSIEDIYQALTVKDVQMAADIFRPLYDRTDGMHGYVSLEVNPHLAHDSAATIAEAHRLWEALARPNVMIKVPATKEGLVCIEELIGAGLNINVTLLFALPRYREVVRAYIRGLQARADAKGSLANIASVASFFLSRIDVLIDPLLRKKRREQGADADIAKRIYGQVAIACAKQATRIAEELFGGEDFAALQAQGARPQRLLWASTSTKEDEFSDIKYVEALIGQDTINTLPRETLEAYRDHGRPEQRLGQNMDEAAQVLGELAQLELVLDDLTEQLEQEGVEKFNKPYDKLLAALQKTVE